MTSQAHRSFICDNERGSQLVQQLKYRHGDKDAALFAFLLAEGISLRTHSPSLRVLLFFIVHIVHFSIFILTVGANLLRGDWNIGLGEPRSLPRQTVILRQTPAHPSPSLHLSDLERCFRIPPLSLFLLPPLSRRERRCFPQPYYHFKDFPTKSAHMASALVWWRGGATELSASKCLWKLRHWEARQCFAAFQPNTGASIPDPTSKLQWGARRGLTVTPWVHCNLGQ